MFFRLWFYACKMGLLGFALMMLSSLLPFGQANGVLTTISFLLVVLVGIAGAPIGIAFCFFGIRSACPLCDTRGEWMFYTKNAIALDCKQCGLVYGNPAWHFKLRVLPYEVADDLEAAANDNATVELPTGPFFERTDTFRLWQYWLSIAFTTAMGGMGVWFFTEGAREYGWELLPFMALWGTLTVPITIYSAYRLLWSPSWHSMIDEHGITVNKKTWSWDEIQTVYERSQSATTSFLCFRLHRFGRERHVHLAPWLSANEAERILDQIEIYVAEKHPHVEI